MEIKIGRSARNCHGCERPFVHEEELNSLVRVEDRQFVREDYCRACWPEDRAKGSYSAWSSAFFDPKVAEQEPPEVFSPLRRVFYDAVEAQERHQLAVAYLAAQLLRRQKVFRYIKESDDPEGDEKLTLFVDKIGNRLIEVRDPNLSHAELEAARSVLMERLEVPGDSETDMEASVGYAQRNG